MNARHPFAWGFFAAAGAAAFAVVGTVVARLVAPAPEPADADEWSA